MKLLIHDYAGHPFQVELSRKLAARGHEVIHAWFGGDAGPKGNMKLGAGDAGGLRFVPLCAGEDYSKTNFIKRRAGDLKYAAELSKIVHDEKPDLVISGNTPTEAQQVLPKACAAVGAAFVYWCQDFYSIAATRILEKRLPGVGHIVGFYYRHLDRSQMLSADHVLLITEAFRGQTEAWGVPAARTSVIANWGALDEIPSLPKQNAWRREQGLGERPVCLYSGTLAMKHDPSLLLAVSREIDAEMIVAATGTGVEDLKDAKARDGLDRLHLLPLQPFAVLPQMLASADVLVAMIERDAGEFSVPSKVLSYLCAGRPIVLAAPKANLASQILVEAGAGKVVEPEDREGFAAAVRSYLDDKVASERAGRAARAYAENNFDLDRVADRFERVFTQAVKERQRRRS